MAEHSWHRDYISSLMVQDPGIMTSYETLEFLCTQLKAEPNAIQELLLHRTIARLGTSEDLLQLLVAVTDAGWTSYTPRIVAKLADFDRLRSLHPEYADYIDSAMRQDTVFAPYSVNDWHLLSNEPTVTYHREFSWSRRIVDIEDIVNNQLTDPINADDIKVVLQYFFDANVRFFQIAIATFTTQDPKWSNVLHKVLSAPCINVRVVPMRVLNEEPEDLPGGPWAPNWCLFMDGVRRNNWKIYERQTQVSLPGQGDKGLLEQFTILLSLSGLLRDGLMLAPINSYPLVVPSSLPIWGFKDRQFVAGGTGYHAHDIRAIALAFLELAPSAPVVSAFRSRLAMYFLGTSVKRRRSAAAATLGDGFFAFVVDIAKLFSKNDFKSVLKRIDNGFYTSEPVLEHFYDEAAAALTLLSEAYSAPTVTLRSEASYPDRILCVAHASEPHQSGGYAVRAHGILKHLKEQNVDISAVTRPGFPYGEQTEFTTDIVDGIEYLRLPGTGVPRENGEIRHMLSFVKSFEDVFRTKGIGKVHLRSTYFIALPALIAARRLGLKVVYEISGLWDLVYQDQEKKSQLLQRSSFPVLAESTVISRSDRVVVMNEPLKDIALARGADKSDIYIAPNAVDIDDFKPLEEPTTEIFTVGYVGSFVNYEGLERLVDAVKLLKEWGIPVRFLAVGDGLRREPIVRRIKEEDLSGIIQMPGRVPHDKVIDYYRQMDVMVYPRISTGTTEAITPLKPFEALALAKPIIVSDIAPLREIVGENERGLVFENGSVENLALAILELFRNPALRRKLGYAGREWVVKYRNWENVVKVFIDAYNSLS